MALRPSMPRVTSRRSLIRNNVVNTNWFGMSVAVLQLLASIESAYHGDWRRAAMYITFSVGSAIIAWK